MATVEDHTNQSGDEMEPDQIIEAAENTFNPAQNVVAEDLKSENEMFNDQNQERDPRKKRLCFKIDKLFNTLFEDLNLLCEWENDEKKRGSNDKS